MTVVAKEDCIGAYSASPEGSNDCPSGYQPISDRDTCLVAIAALGYLVDGTYDRNIDSIPPGCSTIYPSRSTVWNAATSGQSTSTRGILCQKESTTHVPTTTVTTTQAVNSNPILQEGDVCYRLVKEQSMCQKQWQNTGGCNGQCDSVSKCAVHVNWGTPGFLVDRGNYNGLFCAQCESTAQIAGGNGNYDLYEYVDCLESTTLVPTTPVPATTVATTQADACDEISWRFEDQLGEEVYCELTENSFGSAVGITEPIIQTCCLPLGTAYLRCYDEYGDGWGEDPATTTDFVSAGRINIAGQNYCDDFYDGVEHDLVEITITPQMGNPTESDIDFGNVNSNPILQEGDVCYRLVKEQSMCQKQWQNTGGCNGQCDSVSKCAV